MSLPARAEAYAQLRQGRYWTLLAADDAPVVLALFQTIFLGESTNGSVRRLFQSSLLDRIAEGLDDLRARGYSMSQTAQAYLNIWRSKGWLTRTLRQEDAEESYSLAPEVIAALRHLEQLLKPRTVATESRLASVMLQVIRLADDTDKNPASRLAALQAERDRIDQEIAAVRAGRMETLPDDRALERTFEIADLVEGLLDDFQNVTASFRQLNQQLRTHIVEAEGSRGAVLDRLFEGVDLINQSDAGRSFNALWGLLMDESQRARFETAVDQLLCRQFAGKLESAVRDRLRNLTPRLLREAIAVQEVRTALDHSLNRFVRSEDPSKNRRLLDTLQRANLAVMAIKDRVNPRDKIDFHLPVLVPQIRSAAQWQLHEPASRAPVEVMQESPAGEGGSLSALTKLTRGDIDWRSLRSNVKTALTRKPRVSLGELMDSFPVGQASGTFAGYFMMGLQHGEVSDTDTQIVRWTGYDGVLREARIPTIQFTAEKASHYE